MWNTPWDELPALVRVVWTSRGMNKDLWDCNSDAIACQSIMIGKNGKAGFFASGLSNALDAIGQLISERGETVEPRPYVSVLLLNEYPPTDCLSEVSNACFSRFW